MASLTERGDPESSSDSDTLSLTSTAVSEQQEQYVIDRILAEREVDGEQQWLVAWEGYPLDRHSWEPRDMFMSEQTFDDWRTAQMRTTRGLESAFDVAKWEKDRAAIQEETRLRKKRRNEKRRAAGWQMPEPSSPVEQSDNSEPHSSKPEIKQQNLKQRAPDAKADAHLPWTDDETRALETGLRRVGGPFMDRILGLYGIHGKENQVLENRKVLDLQAKAFQMKMEFVGLNREPPDYLKAVDSRRRSHAPDHSKLRSRRQDDQGLQSKQTELDQSQNPMKPIKSAANQQSENSGNRLPSRSHSTQQSPTGNQPLLKTYTGTARPAATVALKHRKEIQWGKVGSGPARLPLVKPKPPGLSRRKSVVAADVAAKWDAMPPVRKRKTDTGAIITGDKSIEQAKPFRFYKNLSHQHNATKLSNSERAPNVDQLIFIDPKTGKAPKGLKSTPSTPSKITTVPAKRPFQLYQEQLETEQVKKTAISQTSKQDQTVLVENSQGVEDSTLKVNDAGRPENDSLQNDLAYDDAIVQGSLRDLPLESGAVVSVPLSSSLPPSARTAPHESSAYGPWQPPNEHARSPDRTPFMSHYLLSADPTTEGAMHSRFQPAPTTRVSVNTATSPTSFSITGNPTPQDRLDLFKIYQINHVIGNILTGSNRKDLGKVKFCGLTREQQRLLLGIRSPEGRLGFHFTKICTAMEYEGYFHRVEEGPVDIFGSGYVVPYPETSVEVENMATALGNRLAGAFFFSTNFSVLVWPVGSTVWQFLEHQLPSVPPGAILRFAVRPPSQVNHLEPLPKEIVKFAEEMPDLFQETKRKIEDAPTEGEKPITTIFRDMYDIDYNRLITSNDPKATAKSDSFFLCFVPATQELWDKDPISRRMARERTSAEHDYLVKFLEASGAKEIYSMQKVGSTDIDKSGAWDYFRHNVKNGCIIFHEEFIRHDHMVGLAKLLRNGFINVFLFNTKPIITRSKWPHLIRLFPNGGCLLVTDSLFLRRPHNALRILRWFRLIILGSRHPGSWKVAMRPRPIKWILQMMDHLQEGKDDHPGTYQLYADICSEIILMLLCEPNSNLVQSDDIDIPKPNAPIICPNILRHFDQSLGCGVKSNIFIDPKAIANNDEILVTWFAETSMTRFEQFRRFQIISGYERGDKEGHAYMESWADHYAHCDIFVPEDYCKMNRIPDPVELQQKEDQRIARVRAEAPAKKAQAIKARRQRLENTAGRLRSIMFEARKEQFGEDTVRWLGRDFLKQLAFSAEEVSALQVLDNGVAVLPGEGGEFAWTRGLDRYGRKMSSSDRGGGGGAMGADADVDMANF